jgi:hypothetical protein
VHPAALARTLGYAPAMAREVLLLSCELLLYGAGMLAVFRARHRVGLGVFLTAIGSLHFLETWLAANLYVQIAPGLVLSPGSVSSVAGGWIRAYCYARRLAATQRIKPARASMLGAHASCGSPEHALTHPPARHRTQDEKRRQKRL